MDHLGFVLCCFLDAGEVSQRSRLEEECRCGFEKAKRVTDSSTSTSLRRLEQELETKSKPQEHSHHLSSWNVCNGHSCIFGRLYIYNHSYLSVLSPLLSLFNSLHVCSRFLCYLIFFRTPLLRLFCFYGASVRTLVWTWTMVIPGAPWLFENFSTSEPEWLTGL